MGNRAGRTTAATGWLAAKVCFLCNRLIFLAASVKKFWKVGIKKGKEFSGPRLGSLAGDLLWEGGPENSERTVRAGSAEALVEEEKNSRRKSASTGLRRRRSGARSRCRPARACGVHRLQAAGGEHLEVRRHRHEARGAWPARHRRRDRSLVREPPRPVARVLSQRFHEREAAVALEVLPDVVLEAAAGRFLPAISLT